MQAFYSQQKAIARLVGQSRLPKVGQLNGDYTFNRIYKLLGCSLLLNIHQVVASRPKKLQIAFIAAS